MTTRTTRSYSELIQIDSFEDRFRYLTLQGQVGRSTFGFDRWLNQQFYTSRDWKRTRRDVIARDMGCDLAMEGYEIYDRIVIHHMNPLTVDDLVEGDDDALNPEFLISTTHNTHNAIHYGDERLLPKAHVSRRPGDTKLW